MERKGSQPSDYFAKTWNPKFAKPQEIKEEDKSYVEVKRGIDAEDDDFGIFFRDSEDVLSCRAEECQEFMKGTTSSDLKSGSGTAGQRRCAWIDDRSPTISNDASGVREYKDRVTTPTGLYRLLDVPRFGDHNNPDADRRLILIRDLDPHSILALGETASIHQVEALRDAIWKHLALKTSISIEIPPGFLVFRMEINIPYFQVKSRPTPTESHSPPATKFPERQWIDLSFLNIKPTRASGQEIQGIREAHFSLSICGFENRRWVGWSFLDSHEGDDELNDQVFPSEGVHNDPISNGALQADIPTWDPREYFLVILKNRLHQVHGGWEYLVLAIERSIKRYKLEHSATLSGQSPCAGRPTEDAKRAFDWTQQTIELLSQLREFLSSVVKAWKTFASSGDLGYFSDIGPSSGKTYSEICKSFCAISSTIEAMEGLLEKLQKLDRSCRDSAEALQLRLTLEANEAVRKNGLLTLITVSIISPVMAVIGLFSIPETYVPFRLNPKYFGHAIVSTMILVQLLFIAITYFPGAMWWWEKGKTWLARLRTEVVRYFEFCSRRRGNGDVNANDQGQAGGCTGEIVA